MVHHIDLKKFEKSHILVIGDIMLDRYLWGDVQRISPEAPVPVFHIREGSEVTGGAGNVVSNLAGLGCSVTVIGVCGNDAAGERLNSLLNNGKVKSFILKDLERPTVVKTRIISSGQQLLRLDDEKAIPVNSNIKNNLIDLFKDSFSSCDAIVLSDYGKGVLKSPGLAQSIISLSNYHNIPVMVDPKGKDWDRYKGATCVTPNTKELIAVYGDTINGKEKLIKAMRSILVNYNLTWLLVTRGPLGMCLMNQDEEPIFISALAREVYDVSGAGDTVIATLSLGVASGLSFQDAANVANLAAGIVVGKLGTQPINFLELKASLGISGTKISGKYISKIISLSAAKIQVKAWQANGEKIVFTNGCFDLLHPGHIHLLNQAKELGDRLIVGINSDASVRRLKGSNRPILNEHDRASILGALDCVDQVVVFDKDTPEDLLEALKPNILAKGADYRIEEVVGREIVESYEGQVQLIPILKGYSTTDITNNILQAHK
jgi:D-beta-D-heptose 7-phosphate kinase / D-beta-D-heptose 1-phosphate adenosyltransferase